MQPVAELPIRVDQQVLDVLNAMVSRGDLRVPPYPAIALKVQKVLSKENHTGADLVDAMRADAVFSAMLLRLANSPFYRRGTEVTSLAVAVQRVGPKELLRLAMAQSLSGLVRANGRLQAERRRLWRQALTSALLSEALAKQEGANSSESFLAGLLHDAGKLMVLEALEELLAEHPEMASDGWRDAVEQLHVKFGETLAQHWQLPGLFGAVIATHHDAPATLGPLTRRVVLADLVGEQLDRRVVVRASDLEQVGVARTVANELEAIIPHLPPTLAAFDGPPERRGEGRGPQARVHHPMAVEVLGEEVRTLAVTRASEELLEVLAPAATPENTLLELRTSPGSVQLWVLVTRSERRPDGWALALRPFALSAASSDAWGAFVTEARALEAA